MTYSISRPITWSLTIHYEGFSCFQCLKKLKLNTKVIAHTEEYFPESNIHLQIKLAHVTCYFGSQAKDYLQKQQDLESRKKELQQIRDAHPELIAEEL